jgi:hypothetical protein
MDPANPGLKPQAKINLPAFKLFISQGQKVSLTVILRLKLCGSQQLSHTSPEAGGQVGSQARPRPCPNLPAGSRKKGSKESWNVLHSDMWDFLLLFKKKKKKLFA